MFGFFILVGLFGLAYFGGLFVSWLFCRIAGIID